MTSAYAITGPARTFILFAVIWLALAALNAILSAREAVNGKPRLAAWYNVIDGIIAGALAAWAMFLLFL